MLMIDVAHALYGGFKKLSWRLDRTHNCDG